MSEIPQTSPVLSLPYIQPSQAQKHVTHNVALAALDLLVQAVAADRDRTDPPAAPTAGAVHLVAAGAQGDWAAQDHALAVFDGTGWRFAAPRPGWRVHVLADGFDVIFDGSAWGPARPDLDNLPGLGVNTTADTANPLAVAGDATLLTHAGSGHQLKINKSAAGDTASLLFQTGWSGRAEMGTAGSDAFAIKVSADGAAWTTALGLDAAGLASGAAIQQSATDTGAGRLARPIVHAIDFLDAPAVHHAIVAHLFAAGAALFGGLKDDHHGAIEIARLGQVFGRAQQHGGVAVMAAGMHRAWGL